MPQEDDRRQDEQEVEQQVRAQDEREREERDTARGRLELEMSNGRVRHYGTRSNLHLEEIVDCGRSGRGGEQRFTIRSSLMRSLRETVRKMQLVLDSLRSVVPTEKGAYQIDPSEAFLGRLEESPSLEDLQLAWVGITNRIMNSRLVYEKMYDLTNEDAVSQPASTPSTIYRRIEREEDPARRFRMALGGLPSHPGVPDTQQDLIHIDTPIREAFPPREEERHAVPPNSTHNNPLEFNPAPPPVVLEEDPAFVEAREALQAQKKKKKAGRPSTFGLLGARGQQDDEEEDDGEGDYGANTPYPPAPPPPPPPTTNAGGQLRPRGPGRARQTGRGGGGGGGPPGGGVGTSGLRIPYGETAPSVNPVIKPSDLPSWDGNRDRAISYFGAIVELARNGGHLPRALGEWLWTRLTPFSSSEARRDHMRLSYHNYIDTICDHYLGPAWRFRDAKHPKESPQDYLYRRIQLSRILGYAEEDSLAEARLIMSKAPKGWKLSTDELSGRIMEKNRAAEAEAERARTRTAWKPSSHQAASRQEQVLDAEVYSDDEDNWGEEEEAPSAPSGARAAPASQGTASGSPDLVAAAYTVAKRQVMRRPATPMFPPANHVRSKGKKPPPGPCFACGSPNHWNKDCPHWDEYQERGAREANQAEWDRTAQVAYDTAYVLIVEQGFDRASRPSLVGEEESKTQDSRAEESPRREVFIASTPCFFQRVEEIHEDYWHQGECLPVDSLDDLEYIYAEAEEDAGLADRGVREEVNLAERELQDAPPAEAFKGEWEEDTSRALVLPKPYDPSVIRLRPRKPLPRQLSKNISVLSVRGRVGARGNATIDLRLDSCASTTFVSGSYYDNLQGPKRIEQGEPMNLLQLTSAHTPIRGTTRLAVTFDCDDGSEIEVETDMYVVDGMTVDILLGEDFQQAYEISHPITAVGVSRTKDFEKISKSRGQFKRIRRHRKNLKEQARLADSLVRSEQQVRLPPHSVVKVKVNGPFKGDEEWVVEKLMLASGEDQITAVPNTILSADSPFIPVANPSDTPRMIRVGDVLGRAAKASDFFDQPKDPAERDKLARHAAAMAQLCALQGEISNGRKGASPDLHMPDKKHYEEWRARPEPAKSKLPYD
ncbi:hypothetical protein GGF50DRAFT_131820 [Schizophyllum commune]